MFNLSGLGPSSGIGIGMIARHTALTQTQNAGSLLWTNSTDGPGVKAYHLFLLLMAYDLLEKR